MITKRLLALFIPICLFSSLSTQAAGPMGHFIIARKVISNIAAGGFTAPNELVQLLRDADCQRAYCAGAIGPDLVEAKSHYGYTANLVRKMFAQARADQKKAAAAKDAKAFATGKQELAFSYGWVSHFIMDMNTHQLVNGMQGIGDAYGYTTQAQKLSHGIYEAQLCAYLRRTIWNTADKYDVLIPYAFVAAVVGVSEPSVRQMAVVLKGKTAGELLLSSKCELSTEQLAKIWNHNVTTSLQEVAKYLAAPETLENWDMDVGHISTDDFDTMRTMVIEINDGKLPPDWGKQYPVFWEAIKDLSKSERYAKLMELLGKTATIPSKYRLYLSVNGDQQATGYKEMPGDWNEFSLSVALDIELNREGGFSFSKTITDPPGMGHMSTTISGSGTLSPKGVLTVKGTVTGGQSYVSRLNSDGPDIRFTQSDSGSFNASKTVVFKRNSKGVVSDITLQPGETKGQFASTMTLTELDKNGNDVSTKSYACSGSLTPKSGVTEIDLRK